MSEERWFLEESGDPEFGFQWNLMVREGDRLRCIAQYLDEEFAVQGLSAHKWLDSLGSGMMRLAMDGIVLDSNTGKVWKAPKGRKAPSLKIEPTKKAPTRKPNS